MWLSKSPQVSPHYFPIFHRPFLFLKVPERKCEKLVWTKMVWASLGLINLYLLRLAHYTVSDLKCPQVDQKQTKMLGLIQKPQYLSVWGDLVCGSEASKSRSNLMEVTMVVYFRALSPQLYCVVADSVLHSLNSLFHCCLVVTPLWPLIHKWLSGSLSVKIGKRACFRRNR